ncbi:hypothetical protein DICVIV_07163 [Dictyocaulus viviparus]|uniref:Uncharacterized protein n=1 Tax=Dictyocaulus viviparus TaxID=29172 RepID=A0A0D8XSI6_DICVI|nr:hypothetical protein DICVIV_07163 [Dictyocaulus viviparus]
MSNVQASIDETKAVPTALPSKPIETTLAGHDQESTSTPSMPFETETSSTVESSGEELAGSDKMSNVQASIDETKAVPTALPSKPIETTLAGHDQESTSTPSMPFETETSSTVESSGEELAGSDKMSNVQASIDETKSVPTALPSKPIETTLAGHDQVSASTPTIPIEIETSSTLESSGVETVQGNRVPNVQASVDETTAAPSDVPKEPVNTKASVDIDQKSTSTPSIPTESETSKVEANINEVKGAPSESPSEPIETTLAGNDQESANTPSIPTEIETSSTLESSREETVEVNRVPNVEASIDETTTVSSDVQTEPVNAKSSVGTNQKRIITASLPTETESSSALESSGKEPAGDDKMPNVQASIDETKAVPTDLPSKPSETTLAGHDQELTSTPTIPTETETSSTWESSGEETVEGNRELNVEASIDETTAAPSEVPKEPVDVKSSVGINHKTITASIPTETELSSTLESSGEETVEGNRELNVEASIDEATAAPSGVSTESLDTKSSFDTDQKLTSTPSILIGSETSKVDASIDEVKATSAELPSESIETTLAGHDQESAGTPTIVIETETSSTINPIESETSSTVESNGEEPLQRNNIPNVELNIDETKVTSSKMPSESIAGAAMEVLPDSAANKSTLLDHDQDLINTSSFSTEFETLAKVGANIDEAKAASSDLPSEPNRSISASNDHETTSIPTISAGSLPSSTVETNGEEPLGGHKMPNLEASIDETKAAPSMLPSEPVEAKSPFGNYHETTSIPSVLIETSRAVIPTESETSSTIKSSGEEPIQGKKLPNIESNIDETKATSYKMPSESITGTAAEVYPKSAATKSTSADHDQNVTSTPSISTEFETLSKIEANIDEVKATSSGLPSKPIETTLTNKHQEASTTSIPIDIETSSALESSGEETVVGNRVPNVEASIDETRTLSSDVQTETVNAKSSIGNNQETILPAFIPTETESSSPLESSGEKPIEHHKMPNSKANKDQTKEVSSELAFKPIETTSADGDHETARTPTIPIGAETSSPVGASEEKTVEGNKIHVVSGNTSEIKAVNRSEIPLQSVSKSVSFSTDDEVITTSLPPFVFGTDEAESATEIASFTNKIEENSNFETSVPSSTSGTIDDVSLKVKGHEDEKDMKIIELGEKMSSKTYQPAGSTESFLFSTDEWSASTSLAPFIFENDVSKSTKNSENDSTDEISKSSATGVSKVSSEAPEGSGEEEKSVANDKLLKVDTNFNKTTPKVKTQTALEPEEVSAFSDGEEKMKAFTHHSRFMTDDSFDTNMTLSPTLTNENKKISNLKRK